jgi:hypothetical protein
MLTFRDSRFAHRTPLLAFRHDLDERRTDVLLLHAVDGALSNVLTQPRHAPPLGLSQTVADPRPDQATPHPSPPDIWALAQQQHSIH